MIGRGRPRWVLAAALLSVGFGLAARPAQADGAGKRVDADNATADANNVSNARNGTPASAAAMGAATAAPARVFALIVTNNRSATLSRPDLKYADDDGAHYHALFRGLARAEDVVLLTRFDASSAQAYPALQPGLQPPRVAQVHAALVALRARVEAARRAGERAIFYFVFAGHGDVDRGKGFLELEDGHLDADFLEREVVEGVPADVQHIILDSCNSFFVINPRKPGGRRWATPQDLTSGFSQRHPQVGLLLSTNAEAEVYEWSELSAGIFSYEVRAGLSGAADADGDGVIRYDELAGYLENANRDILNDDLRPRVLARGPFGYRNASLFTSAALAGPALVVGPGQRHVWIRGARGERVLDVHKERAGVVKVVLPVGAGPFSVYEQSPAAPGERPVTTAFPIPPERPSVTLAELSPAPAPFGTRGGEAIFGRLYEQAWGPEAFARYLHGGAQDAEAIYGVPKKEEGPIRRYLQRLGELGGKGVAATGELADAVLPESVMDPLRAHAPTWLGGTDADAAGRGTGIEPGATAGAMPGAMPGSQSGAPALGGGVAKAPSLPRPGPWDDGRVASGDSAFTLHRHDVRLSLLGRSAVCLSARTELSTIFALDFSLFPNLSLKHRFAESEHVAAGWKLGLGGGFYAVALAGASPFPVLVGHSGYALGAYQLAEAELSLQAVRRLTFTLRAGGVGAQARAGENGFATAHDALAFHTGGGSAVWGWATGFETDLVLSAHDALVLDVSAFFYQRSDYALVSAVLGWTHAFHHLHVSVGALAVLDLAREEGVASDRRILPWANLDWTF